MTRSMCLRAAIKPLSNKCWNSIHSGDSNPPITSTNSGVNLNGDCSKPNTTENVINQYYWIRCSAQFSTNDDDVHLYTCTQVPVNSPKFFGEMLRINPKSMCIKWPSECSKMFPLCLWIGLEFSFFALISINIVYITKCTKRFAYRSLTCSKYEIRQ